MMGKESGSEVGMLQENATYGILKNGSPNIFCMTTCAAT